MPLSAKDVSARIDTHEAVCAERWKETIERIKRLEMILIGACGRDGVEDLDDFDKSTIQAWD